MKDLDIVSHHEVIRDTIGYEAISKMESCEIPYIMDFLKIVHNYKKIKKLKKVSSE